MRDAFGGAFMIRLFLVFIIIYVGFTAIALNYAKAFKVKNKVIDYIEANEITDIKKMSAAAYSEMKDYFEYEIHGNMNYNPNKNINCNPMPVGDMLKSEVQYCENGIRIEKIDPSKVSNGSNKLGVYYRVSTTVGWSIPFINKILNLNGEDGKTVIGTWIISGETRTIVRE